MKALSVHVDLPSTSRLADRRSGYFAFFDLCWLCGAPARVTCGACKTLRYCSTTCRQQGCSTGDTSDARTPLCAALRTSRLAVSGRLAADQQLDSVLIPSSGRRKHATPFYKSLPSSLQQQLFDSKVLKLKDVCQLLKDVHRSHGGFESGWLALHFQVRPSNPAVAAAPPQHRGGRDAAVLPEEGCSKLSNTVPAQALTTPTAHPRGMHPRAATVTERIDCYCYAEGSVAADTYCPSTLQPFALRKLRRTMVIAIT